MRTILAIVTSILLWGQSARADDAVVFRSGNEVIVAVERLDLLRQAHKQLTGTVQLTGAGGPRLFTLDFTDPVTPPAILIDVTGYGACTGVTVEIKDGNGKAVLSQRVSPVPTVTIPNSLPMQQGAFAAIEPGSKLDPAATPKIALPDLTKLRSQKLAVPTRSIAAGEITYPVIADADLPGSGSANAVVVSRQSFAPGDSTKCSLYFSYRKPLYDSKTMRLTEWRKMLVEVPLDRAWLDKQGDELITLPPDRFAIHTTDERERAGQRWNAPDGYNMLGGSSAGLYQGGQTVDTDDQGRIYITNVADGAGVVRFNPHTGKFEQPPVNVHAEARKFIPASGDWKRSWDADLAQVVCTRGRVYLVFDRNYRVRTPNGNFETCNGVISIPQDNWLDAEAFKKDIRLHAACWPTAKFPMYGDELAAGGARRVGPPQATKHGITFGTFRLDLDSSGNTERLAVIKDIKDTADIAGKPLPPTAIETVKGLPKQRLINVAAAGRKFVEQSYGQFTISRAALALTMPDAPAHLLADSAGRHLSTFADAPTGQLTVRFDITSKIKSDLDSYGALAKSMSGVSQGPAYAVIPIPGEADQAIGVCEYNYFFSKLDFSRRVKDGRVYKSYLTQSSGGQNTGFPVAVGLGPYNSTWVEHDNARWLYMMGYTGMSRLKYAEAGRTMDAFSVDVFHGRLSPQPIDGVGRDSVKDYLHIIPATDGRLINIGRGRVGRGGGARSAGLELFDPRDLRKSQSAVEMNRCFGLHTPVSRLVYSTSSAAPRQELFVASGEIRPEYVADIDDPARRPKNQDPKIFAYDCASGGGLRDLYGFSLPLFAGGRDSSANLVFSPCRQFLVAMQEGGTLLTYSVAQRRFVDGVHLRDSLDQPIRPLSFIGPSATIWTAPDGRIFFHAALDGEQSKSVNFYEVQIAHDGRLTVLPHLVVTLDKDGRVRDYSNIVRCFLPDIARGDGSYDLVIGSDKENGGQPNVRVITDFITP